MNFFFHQNKVHMYDTDSAGILYFANQFRFVHDAFESFLEHLGYAIADLFKKNTFLFVIVHAESDYKDSLLLGDNIDISLFISKLGTTSVTFEYNIYRSDKLVGTSQTVHVCIDKKTKKKIEIPVDIRNKLQTYVN